MFVEIGLLDNESITNVALYCDTGNNSVPAEAN